MSANLSRACFFIAFPEGRLGNAVFHYLALTSYFDLASIYTNYFSNKLGVTLPMPNLSVRILTRIFERLGKERAISAARLTRLFSHATLDVHAPVPLVFITTGLLPIAVLNIIDTTDSRLLPLLRNTQPSQLLSPVSSYSFTPNDHLSPKVDMYFLHVRRTDYISWPSRSSPAVLPLSWYYKAIKTILTYDSSAHFLIASDDIPYCKDVFTDSRLFTFSQPEKSDDFLAMTSCTRGGILSASTYSLLASYYGSIRHVNAKYYAPLYWFGWPISIWQPSIYIRAAHVEYISV